MNILIKKLFITVLFLCFANVAISESVVFVQTDLLGSPVLETDEAGNILGRSYYKSYGETKDGQREGVGYTGHLEDADLGLTYMQARYYDPVLGRFYGNDAVGFDNVHNFNRYAYANNNPYLYIDPDGRDVQISFAIKSGGGAAIAGELSRNLVINFGKDGVTYQSSATKAYGVTTPQLSTVLEVGLHKMDNITDFLGEGIDFTVDGDAGLAVGATLHGTSPTNNPGGNAADITGVSFEAGVGVSATIVGGAVVATDTVATGDVKNVKDFVEGFFKEEM
ncbi:hypothetical protein NO559_03975 [Dasania sp. GY-MA-18]|uniref:Teneurin-like YD-shell domain-containing protein n=1 Tax=Dasania phycosphaerae TaxID=2950436 RepID=A0A9J6RI34_9GAMM|nr:MULTISPECIES: RHS repeat-associated core domain-containing protein [Dasania]MCR8921914.1 hypothetical protein [Dasania sp. GY-MA-18]MCZ0864342.1 hypothetical protein [Dasania phycosphaerae]MCZ0868070.1 hypothetical protein [Dasania phycosphaerae]